MSKECIDCNKKEDLLKDIIRYVKGNLIGCKYMDSHDHEMLALFVHETEKLTGKVKELGRVK